MIQREKAVMTPANGRVETPEIRSKLDYTIGDLVQLGSGARHAGSVGVIIGIRARKYHKYTDYELAYTVRLNEKESVETTAENLKFLRHDDNG